MATRLNIFRVHALWAEEINQSAPSASMLLCSLFEPLNQVRIRRIKKNTRQLEVTASRA